MGSCQEAPGAQLGLCDDLEGWNGGLGVRKPQEGGDICIHTADSCCCAAETNAML